MFPSFPFNIFPLFPINFSPSSSLNLSTTAVLSSVTCHMYITKHNRNILMWVFDDIPLHYMMSHVDALLASISIN